MGTRIGVINHPRNAHESQKNTFKDCKGVTWVLEATIHVGERGHVGHVNSWIYQENKVEGAFRVGLERELSEHEIHMILVNDSDESSQAAINKALNGQIAAALSDNFFNKFHFLNSSDFMSLRSKYPIS